MYNFFFKLIVKATEWGMLGLFIIVVLLYVTPSSRLTEIIKGINNISNISSQLGQFTQYLGMVPMDKLPNIPVTIPTLPPVKTEITVDWTIVLEKITAGSMIKVVEIDSQYIQTINYEQESLLGKTTLNSPFEQNFTGYVEYNPKNIKIVKTGDNQYTVYLGPPKLSLSPIITKMTHGGDGNVFRNDGLGGAISQVMGISDRTALQAQLLTVAQSPVQQKLAYSQFLKTHLDKLTTASSAEIEKFYNLLIAQVTATEEGPKPTILVVASTQAITQATIIGKGKPSAISELTTTDEQVTESLKRYFSGNGVTIKTSTKMTKANMVNNQK
jgi:hypothetical protein